MLYPITLSSHRRIIIVPEGWFDRIGRLDMDRAELTLGIPRLGEQGLAWFIRADGLFHPLQWRGRVQRGPAQWLGWSRQRECYGILAGRSITCGELLDRIRDHADQFAEAPHTQELRACLLAQEAGRLLDRELMARYLGQ
ncbi:UNVERIFIED_ORG: hypothetical protein LHJ69_00190 [Shinella sp. XGS7]|nr:hypothetical protein [Shinella sp. XGS7]